MKKQLTRFISLLLIFLFAACQKEISFEEGQLSDGSLNKDAGGGCLPITVAGTYTAAIPVTDSNYLEVTATIITAGTYAVHTDTVNGYSFSASGTFASPGVTTIRLKAVGKPLVADTNRFTVYYNTSSCQADVVVTKNLSDPAGFTLSGAPNVCMNAILQGSYIKAYPTDTACKVLLQVMVNSPGTYSVSTNTVNGYTFSGSGVLTNTGTQTITLKASGTPVNAGADVFSVTAGASACNFTVNVSSPLTITNTDYFPLTYPSFWVYNRSNFANDSIKRTVVDSVMQNGKLYKKMDEYLPFAGGPLYFRKEGADYFEYGRVDKYTTSFAYGTAVNGEILFLKENLTTGTTWKSAEFTGTASFGQTILVRYLFECIDANAAVTVNGNTFGNVYKIRMLPEIASVGNPWGSTYETYTFYYAKGVGLVYGTKTLNGFTQYLQTLKRWTVY